MVEHPRALAFGVARHVERGHAEWGGRARLAPRLERVVKRTIDLLCDDARVAFARNAEGVEGVLDDAGVRHEQIGARRERSPKALRAHHVDDDRALPRGECAEIARDDLPAGDVVLLLELGLGALWLLVVVAEIRLRLGLGELCI